jgi:hypothetical protein
MASTSSMVALAISIMALAVVVWALTETERSRDIYGHSIPESYSVSAPGRSGPEPRQAARDAALATTRQLAEAVTPALAA